MRAGSRAGQPRDEHPVKDFLTKTLFEGLPLEFTPWEILYVMALVVALVFILNRFLFQPVLAILEERERQVRAGQGAADESEQAIADRERAVSQALAKARLEAVAKLDQAKSAAEEARGAKLEAARSDAESKVAAASEALAAARAEAEKALRAEAETLARRIASRLVGREVA